MFPKYYENLFKLYQDFFEDTLHLGLSPHKLSLSKPNTKVHSNSVGEIGLEGTFTFSAKGQHFRMLNQVFLYWILLCHCFLFATTMDLEKLDDIGEKSKLLMNVSWINGILLCAAIISGKLVHRDAIGNMLTHWVRLEFDIIGK